MKPLFDPQEDQTDMKNNKYPLQDSKQPPPKADSKSEQPKEIGGRKDGLDPTRYGDWEKNGRCIDF